MFVDKLELYLVRNRFIEPWRTAYGCDTENCVLMTRMVSGKYEGWSEASPLPGPNYSYEYGEGVFEVASRFLAPMVVGREMDDYTDVLSAMKGVRGNPFAKGGVEMAWWTLKAEMEGVSLRKILGHTGENSIVDEGAGFGICDSYDQLIAKIGRAFDSGAKRVKLKAAHGWDVEMLAVVRSVFPNETIHIDCNSSYTYDEAEVFRKMDKFHLAMIEQPFASGAIYDHAKLQRRLDTPLCLDESVVDTLSVRQALELGACRYVNIKPARVGGLGNSLEINRLCAEAGVGCWVGGMLESDVGKSVCLELASIPNMVYPHDITPERDNYLEPISESQLTYVSPWKLKTSNRAGTPVRPDMEKLTKKTEKKIILTAK